jgi:hypothetical protein
MMRELKKKKKKKKKKVFSLSLFRILYVLFVVTKSRAIFIQRKTLKRELAKNLKNSSFSQNRRTVSRQFNTKNYDG